MRLKKPFFLPIFAALCAIFLCACSGEAEQTDPADQTAAVPDAETVVHFLVTPSDGGYISGISTQTLLGGEKTTAVEAVAAPGFEFVKWSDGEKSAEHRAKKYSEDAEIYAIFEQADTGTPAIYIDTENGQRIHSDEKYVNFTMSVENVPRKLALKQVSGQIKTRGNASLGWQKKSFTIKFTEKQKMLGLGSGKDRNWVLISNHCDQSLMRNYVSFWLQKQLDGIPWGPDCRLVDLYLNGEYEGNYLLIEKITTGGGRIDIEKGGDTGDLEGDFLIEMDNYAYKGGEKGIVWFTARGIPYEIRGEDNLTADRCNYIDDWVTSAWDTVSGGSDEDIKALLDLDAAVDSYILAELTKNIDCGWSSFFLYRRDGKLFLGPSWDFDLALGNDARLDNGSYEKLYAGQFNGFGQQNQWYIALMGREWFVEMVVDRWNSLKEAGLFDKLFAEFDRCWKMNRDSFDHNFERWPIFGQTLNQEPAHIRALSSAEEHVTYLRQWIQDRINWLDDKFNRM